MSLLRRGDRFHPNEAWTNDAQFPLPDMTHEGEDIAWRLRWSHDAPGRLLTMAMTRDGQCFAAGSRAGWVLFYDSTGRLLWCAQVEGAVHRIALAEDARCVLVGTAEQGRAAHLFHFDGRRLHTFETQSEAWGIDLLPDASLIAVGGLNQRLTLYNRAGEVVAVRDVGGPIRHASILAGGEEILVSGDDGVIYALDRTGRDLWQYRTEGRIWAGVRIAHEADLLFAGSNDQHVYALDRAGRILWSFDTGGLVNAVAVTPDGRYCAAAGGANKVFLFDARGEVVWQHTFEHPVHALSLSADGRFTLLSADDNALHVFDHAEDHRIRSYEAGGRIHTLELMPDGRSFAAAITTQGLYVFDRLLGTSEELAHDGAHGVTPYAAHGTLPYLVGRAVVRRVRADYARDGHAGLVRWFTEFQRSLRGRQYGVCQALLDEIGDARSYRLSEGEQQVIRSLEGVRWLFEGVDHHRRGDFETARACYERSQSIQASVNNKDGLGQVIAALSVLPVQSAERVAAVASAAASAGELQFVPDPVLAGGGVDESDSGDLVDEAASCADQDAAKRLLDDIVRRPRILGTAEKLLEQRLMSAPPPEQLQIIVLARRAGYLLPLLRGLEVQDRQVRVAASAALTFLQPGPGDDVLAQMLQSPQSFVRWSAVRMMLARAEDRPDQFEESRSQLWSLALDPETFETLDALARREVALLVECAGTGDDTPWLVARLSDPDIDVRLAAVDALAKVGTREALVVLGNMPDSRGFLGRDLAGAAKDAMSAIETRHPLPSVSHMYLCAEDPLANRRVYENTLFLTDAEAVYCVVDVNHVQPGAQIRVRWLQGNATLFEEVRTLTDELPSVANVQELGPGSRPSPFARPGSNAPRFGAMPAGNEANDGPARRPGIRPFGASSDDRPVEVPSFLRRDPATTSPRPGAPRPDSPRPGAEGALSRFLPLRGAEAAAHPAADRPQRTGLPLSRRRFPSIFDDDDRPSPPRPAFSRPFGGPVVDPLENIDPGRPASEPARNPFARHDAPEPPARPEADNRPESDLPEWLLTEDDEDNGLFGGSRPGIRRSSRPTDSPAGSSPFGGRRIGGQAEDTTVDDDLVDARPGELRRTSRNSSTTRLAFKLSRPQAGWPGVSCHFEIELVSTGVPPARTSFRFVDVPQIARLEPGFVPDRRGAFFTSARRFLTTAKHIACQVQLTDAPLNTLVWGRCYDAQTGMLIGDTSAHSSGAGSSTVLLQWMNHGWPAATYRIDVSVEGSRNTPDGAPRVAQRQTTIDLTEHVSIRSVSVCHRVDDQNGPIGAGWPFKPGDSPWCVVELDDHAPEVSVHATWYSQTEMLHRAKPITPITEKGQRAAFCLELPPAHPLAPGFYSVVIEGDRVSRQEQVFEVQQHGKWTQLKQYTRVVRDTLTELTEGWYPLQFLAVLGGVLLFALALAGVADVLREVLSSSQRSHDEILRLGQIAGASGGGWTFWAWVVAGCAYSALYVRVQRQLADARERVLYTVMNLALVMVGGGLLWYELSYVLFAPSMTQPDAFAGMFGAVHWLAQVLAWCGLPMGLVLAEWYRQGGNTKPFTVAGLSVAIMLAALGLAGYVGLTVGGVFFAIVGAILEGALVLTGVENRVGRAFMIAGTSGGFMLAASAYIYPPVKLFWREWRTAQRECPDSAETRTLLDYALSLAKITRGTWLKLVFVPALVVLGLVVPIVIGMSAVFEPVIVSLLDALYDPADSKAFEQMLSRQPAIPVMALTLWMVWPVIVFGIYRAVAVQGLNLEEKRWLRWLCAGIVLAGISVLLGVALISRTELVNTLAPESLVFWTNRMAALLVGLVTAGWLVSMIWHKPPAVRPELYLSTSAAAWTVQGLAVLGAAFFPFWMWALAASVALIIVTAGTLVFAKIR